jgi:carboxypeptidase C (cathepsin A)
LKLRGLLIGNGWIDPAATYKSYLPFAVANNLIEKDSDLYNSINDEVKLCQQALSKEVHIFEEQCELILDQISVDGPMDNYYAKNHKSRCMNI